MKNILKSIFRNLQEQSEFLKVNKFSFRGNRWIFYFGGMGAFLFIALIALMSLLYIRQQTEERIGADSKSFVKSLDLMFEGQIDAIDVALLSVARDISDGVYVEKTTTQHIESHLEYIRSGLPRTEIIRATNEQGDMVYGNGASSQQVNIADRDYFQQLRDNPNLGLLIAHPLISRVDQKAIWPFVRRINKPDGSFGGVVIASLQIPEIINMFNQVRRSSSSVIALRNQDFSLIARQVNGMNSIPIGDQKVSAKFLEVIKENPVEGTYDMKANQNTDGVNRIISYRFNPKYHFLIVDGIDRDAALVSWYFGVWVTSGVLLSLALSMFFFLRFIEKSWQREERDIILQRKAEIALVERAKEHEKLGYEIKMLQERLSVATNSGHIGIWEYQPTSGILVWDKWMYVLYGIDESNFSGAYEAWVSGLHPDDKMRCQEEIELAIEGKHVFDTQFRVVWPNGEIRHIKAYGESLHEDGNGLCLIGVNYDITDFVRSQENLRQAKDIAESATVAKGNFVANMSHEIRTPMNAIIGLTYLLEQMQLPGDGKELVHKIGIAGKSLLGIINDILDFSKIEAGRIEIEHAPFSLNALLGSLGSILSVMANDKDIEVVIGCVDSQFSPVYGDSLRLEQILLNLCSNAIKFTEHGFVHLTVDLVSNSEKQVSLRFSVTDTGKGISPEQIQQIFDPFSQEDVSTTRNFGGTGLGLTISRQLANLMGGEIAVQSELGHGSTFSFDLAFDRDTNSEISSPELSNLQVLIADDNHMTLDAIGRSTNALGWNAITVESGMAAINAVQSMVNVTMCDVILLDWKMPGMDGLVAARAIRESITDSKVMPIILMVTAYSKADLLADPDSHLIDAVLTKPVTPSSLYNAVATVKRVHSEGLVVPSSALNGQRLLGLRLLVVDDSDINRDVARRIFSGEGAQVVLANDGRQALDYLQSHVGQIDCVLMDVQMPVMDGYEATHLIRSNPQLALLPVIALTAGAFKEQEELANNAGMSGFISKPFNVNEAIYLIQKLSGHNGITKFDTATVKDPIVPGTDQDLPGLEVGKGLLIWKNTQDYQHYLRKFVLDYGNSVQELNQLDSINASKLAHKLTGAAGMLALTDVSTRSADVDRLLRNGEAVATGYIHLQDALTRAIQSIQIYAPTLDEPVSEILETPDEDRLILLLHQALKAFASDSPAIIRPVLSDLALVLPAEHLRGLQSALENFDFRAGELATNELARRFAILLEPTS